jgi:hypothetical protein
MPSRSPLAPVVAFTLSLLAGCGGQDTLTHEELVSKANEICAEPVSRAQAIVGEAPDPTSGLDEAWVQQLDEAAPLVLTAAQGLASLEPPAEDEDAYTDMVEAYQTLADTMQNAADAAAAGDEALVGQQIAAGLTALQTADAAATALGIEECAPIE